MIDTLLSCNWISGFVGCSVIQMYIEKTGVSKRKANTITCILFQMFFIYNAFINLYLEWYNLYTQDELAQLTLYNMNNIYGYFIYDMVYMLFEHPNIMFLIHHFLSLIIIDTIKKIGVNGPMYHHNIICFLGEVTNPFLNMRYVLHDYPYLKKINQKIIYYTYFTFRIVLFPLFSILFLIQRSANHFLTLFLLFSIIYGVSIMWFHKITNITIN